MAPKEDAAYKSAVGGALKLKGGTPGVHKAKKPEGVIKGSASTTATSPTGAPVKRIVEKTAAELAFEEVMRKRQEERLKKIASKPHKEKVAEFNRYLENLSEHHDIPRVGPG